MPLVRFLRSGTHAGTDFVPGDTTEMNLADAQWNASKDVVFIVSPVVSELQRLESRTLIASKKKNCCFN
jgi:hypothetical protein